MRRHGESGVRPGGKEKVRKAWSELQKIQRNFSWSCLCAHLGTHCPRFLPREPVAGLPSRAGLSCISECQDRGQRYRDARAFSTADSASPPGGAVCTVDSASTAAEALSASRAEAALPQASAILSLQLPGLSSRAPGAPLRGWELGPLCPGSLPCISLALGTPSRLSIPHPELS